MNFESTPCWKQTVPQHTESHSARVLNYKVESDFIKDTIIKSLNEDEIPIDLSNYTLHLKDFETQLNDIKLWTEQPAKGENRIRMLADKIVETYSQIRFSEQDFSRLAMELTRKLWENEQELTKFESRLSKEQAKEVGALERQKKSREYYDKRKGELLVQKGNFVGKLKEAKKKEEEYQRQQIEEVLSRIDKKSDLQLEQQGLTDQKVLLESNFYDIKQKYEIQIDQLNNQFESFRNGQQEKIQGLKGVSFSLRGAFNYYEQTITAINKQYEEKRLETRGRVDNKKRNSQGFEIGDLK